MSNEILQETIIPEDKQALEDNPMTMVDVSRELVRGNMKRSSYELANKSALLGNDTNPVAVDLRARRDRLSNKMQSFIARLAGSIQSVASNTAEGARTMLDNATAAISQDAETISDISASIRESVINKAEATSDQIRLITESVTMAIKDTIAGFTTAIESQTATINSQNERLDQLTKEMQMMREQLVSKTGTNTLSDYSLADSLATIKVDESVGIPAEVILEETSNLIKAQQPIEPITLNSAIENGQRPGAASKQEIDEKILDDVINNYRVEIEGAERRQDDFEEMTKQRAIEFATKIYDHPILRGEVDRLAVELTSGNYDPELVLFTISNTLDERGQLMSGNKDFASLLIKMEELLNQKPELLTSENSDLLRDVSAMKTHQQQVLKDSRLSTRQSPWSQMKQQNRYGRARASYRRTPI